MKRPAKCPRCGSPNPHLFRFTKTPVRKWIKWDDCNNDFHRIVTKQNTAEAIAAHDKYLRSR